MEENPNSGDEDFNVKKQDPESTVDISGNSKKVSKAFKTPVLIDKPSDETMKAVQTIMPSPSCSADSQRESVVGSPLSPTFPSADDNLPGTSTDISTPAAIPDGHSDVKCELTAAGTEKLIPPELDTAPKTATEVDFRCVPPRPPPVLDADQNYVPPEIPEGVKKPEDVVVIGGKWVTMPNRTRVGDVHGIKRDVERFGPAELHTIYGDKDKTKKVFCIPWFSDPGHFNMDIQPEFSETLGEYIYRVLWKLSTVAQPEYEYVWYTEGNLIWAAPKGKLDSEIKPVPKSGDKRTSGRMLSELLPNGHNFSVCQKMLVNDLVPYGSQYYRIHLNRTTDYGIYGLLVDKTTGEPMVVDGVQLTINDLTFIYYASFDRPNLEFAQIHKLVHFLAEGNRDKKKGGRFTNIVNPYQKLIDAANALDDTVFSIASGKHDVSTDSKSALEPVRAQKGRKRRVSDDSMASSIHGSTSAKHRMTDSDQRNPSYDELLQENHQLKLNASAHGVEVSFYKTSAEIAHDNLVAASKTIKEERLKLEDVNGTTAATTEQLRENVARNNDLQEDFYLMAKQNLQQMFTQFSEMYFGGTPGTVHHRATAFSAMRHPSPQRQAPSTPPREAFPSSVLADAFKISSAEKDQRFDRPSTPNKVHVALEEPIAISHDLDDNSEPQHGRASTVFDFDIQRQAYDIENAEKKRKFEEKIANLTPDPSVIEAKREKDADEIAWLESKRLEQLDKVKEKRLSDSPRPQPSTSVSQPVVRLNRVDSGGLDDFIGDDDDNASVTSSSKDIEEFPDFGLALQNLGYNTFTMTPRGPPMTKADSGYMEFNTDDEYDKLNKQVGPDYGQKEKFEGETEHVNSNTRPNNFKFLNQQLQSDGRQLYLMKASEWTCFPNSVDRNVDTHIRGALRYFIGKMFETNRPPEIATYAKLKHCLARTIFFMENFPNKKPSVEQQLITLNISPCLAACVTVALNIGIPFRPASLFRCISNLLRDFKRNGLTKYKDCTEPDPDAMMSAETTMIPSILSPGTPGQFEYSKLQIKTMVSNAKAFGKNRQDFDKILAKRRLTLQKGPIQKKRKIKDDKVPVEVVQIEDTPPPKAPSAKRQKKVETSSKQKETTKKEQLPKKLGRYGAPHSNHGVKYQNVKGQSKKGYKYLQLLSRFKAEQKAVALGLAQ